MEKMGRSVSEKRKGSKNVSKRAVSIKKGRVSFISNNGVVGEVGELRGEVLRANL